MKASVLRKLGFKGSFSIYLKVSINIKWGISGFDFFPCDFFSHRERATLC